MGGGQDKPAWTACPPGVKITKVGGKITRDSLPPGGASCPGGQDKLLHRAMRKCIMSYVNNKGADQPAHPRSLISAFVVRCLDSIISLDSVAEISRL